jgi:Activator of Hsp90 ATPase homolog 1-like protein
LARFIELILNTRIVEAINFDAADPAFSGEMIMEVSFEPIADKTRVTITFNNIPPGSGRKTMRQAHH